ncbi:MAG: hypothetical protein QOE59_4898 [Actinomycetota bacterium]|jgi:hypothetical protein|nr:hypothetical protein [Actinomycetota bacterium]
MTQADDPDDGGALGYVTREGPTPKLVVVAIVWAGFGVFGLFTAMLMHSSGFAIFGALCLVAGVALYFGQRTRDQLAYDELHLSDDPWSPPSDGPVDTEDERPATDEDTTAHSRHDHDDDILDAEYTEWFDYDQSPADQDDGTGYDDQQVAYQRYQEDQRGRDIDGEADGDEPEEAAAEDDEHDDVARTSHIPTGDDEHHTSDGGSGSPSAGRASDDLGSSEHEGSDGRRG